MNIEKDIDFILSHFDNNIFPRKMMTANSNGQFTIYSKNDILKRCIESDFTDCRINAYPEYIKWEKYDLIRQPPNFIFIDLDISNFSKYKYPEKTLDRVLKNTLKNIQVSSIEHTQRSPYAHKQQDFDIKQIHPTVLWTGNGYHIYLPINALVLDQIDFFSKDKFPSLFSSVFAKYSNYYVSEVFLHFAERYFTNGKADPLHRPKYKTCLIRIPGTCNLKCLNKGLNHEESKVKIIQKWNGYRLPIQLLLKYFRRWLIQEELNHKKWINKQVSKYGQNPSSSTFRNNSIEWIEKLIQTPIKDHRKYCLWKILIPYLLNIKEISKKETFLILKKWLEICNHEKMVDFNINNRLKIDLKNDKGFLPVSIEKLKIDNSDLHILFDNKQIF